MFALFLDPLYRAPILGSCLICYAAALMGVCIFLQKRALVSEVISHAAYPGMIIGALVAGVFSSDHWIYLFTGAFLSSLFAAMFLQWLEKKQVSTDAAMTATLSAFFAVGLLFASYLQKMRPTLLVEVQKCLFGEVVTILDEHLLLYAVMSVCITAFVYLFYRRLQIHLFDPVYMQVSGIRGRLVTRLSIVCLVFSVVIGVRACGVILLSAMLIAPASAARVFSKSLSSMFVLAGFFGLASAGMGNAFVLFLSRENGLVEPVFLPTGPSIVLSALVLVIASYVFSPRKGFVMKIIRKAAFQLRSTQENIVKAIHKKQQGFSDLYQTESIPYLPLWISLWYLQREGLLCKKSGLYELTKEGSRKALRLIRFHRLWEVYLTKYMHMPSKHVHVSAEEMEHIITPEMALRLDALLESPEMDPHEKPIPGRFA